MYVYVDVDTCMYIQTNRQTNRCIYKQTDVDTCMYRQTNRCSVYICMYIQTNIRICVYTHRCYVGQCHKHTHMRIHVHIYIHTYVSVCLCVCVCACVCPCMREQQNKPTERVHNHSQENSVVTPTLNPKTLNPKP